MAKKRKTSKVGIWTVNLIISVSDRDKARLITDLESLIDKYTQTSTIVISPEVPNVKEN